MNNKVMESIYLLFIDVKSSIKPAKYFTSVRQTECPHCWTHTGSDEVSNHVNGSEEISSWYGECYYIRRAAGAILLFERHELWFSLNRMIRKRPTLPEREQMKEREGARE